MSSVSSAHIVQHRVHVRSVPGRGITHMYYSKDKRFIVKQITYSEFKKLMSILDGYIAHIEKAAARGRTEGNVNWSWPCFV